MVDMVCVMIGGSPIYLTRGLWASVRPHAAALGVRLATDEELRQHEEHQAEIARQNAEDMRRFIGYFGGGGDG